MDFATAHSCGLRQNRLCSQTPTVGFATAHSCGLRRQPCSALAQQSRLCHSAFVRVATDSECQDCRFVGLCHSAFVRVATGTKASALGTTTTLPQRIRAGCDFRTARACRCQALCHSAFVRVATPQCGRWERFIALCHSAFVRVATMYNQAQHEMYHFATAHSCGLRLRKSNAAHCEFAARR